MRGLANVRGQLLPVIDLRAFLGSGATQRRRARRACWWPTTAKFPAGLLVDEVLGFRRFYESEFSADLPPTLLRCERYLAGAFKRGAEVWPVFSLRSAAREPAVPAGRRVVSRRADHDNESDDDMTNRFDAARLQPVLIAVALVATAAGGAGAAALRAHR